MHPSLNPRQESKWKTKFGKKADTRSKKTPQQQDPPTPLPKKNSRKPRKFRLALHSQLQKDTLWSWKNRMKSSKVCNFFFKELESCFASKRDKERQSSPWHHSRRESLSTKKKKPPKFVQSSNLWDPKTTTLKVNLAILQFSQTQKRKKGDQTGKTPSYDFTSKLNDVLFSKEELLFSLSLWPPPQQPTKACK